MNRWMALARSEAQEGMNRGEGGPFGALIVREDQIIAQTHNTVLGTNDPTAHAEINAIRAASAALGRFDLSDCVLYTSCYPCPMCLGAILWARIPTVYYGATTEDAARGGFDDARFHAFMHNPASVLGLHPLDSDESSDLFAQWLAKEDRKAY